MLIHVLRSWRRRLGALWRTRRHWLRILRRARHVRKRRGLWVFIDLGASEGDTAKLALKCWPRLDRLILFEPAAARFARLREVFADDPRVECIQAAAGTAEGKARLYRERPLPDGRFYDGCGDSLCADKRNVDLSDYEEVRVADFPSFLLAHTQPEDRVILKVDIEGAEYELLEALLRTGALDRVTRLFCEWHGDKRGLPPEQHAALVARLQQAGFPITGINRYDEFSLRRRERA